MRYASPDLWEPQGGNDLGPPGSDQTSPQDPVSDCGLDHIDKNKTSKTGVGTLLPY